MNFNVDDFTITYFDNPQRLKDGSRVDPLYKLFYKNTYLFGGEGEQITDFICCLDIFFEKFFEFKQHLFLGALWRKMDLAFTEGENNNE